MKPLPLLDIGGIWHISYFVGLSVFVLVFIFRHGRKLPLSAKLLLSYALLWCLFIVEYPKAHFGPYTHDFQSTAAQVLIEAILIPFAAITFFHEIEIVIPFLALFESVCVWMGRPGLLHAPSFNMALAALCLPMIRSKLLWGFVIATALSHHGSTALMIMSAQLFCGVIKGRYEKRLLVAAFPVMALSAYLLQKQPMFNSGERIERWIQFMMFWAQDWKRITLGAGPGSFVWFSIMNHPYQTGFYLQMHCDYLEVVWALGIIGALLTGWMIFDAIKRAWGMPIPVLQSLAGALAFMLTYEPICYFPTALLITWIFVRVLVIDDVHVKFADLLWSV